MKLSEVIAPIKPIGPAPTVVAKPSAGSTATTGNISANIAPTANTVTSTTTTASPQSAGSTTPPPISTQGVDALAQLIKSAGLSPTQISQLVSKAK